MIKDIKPSLAEAGKIKIGRKGEMRKSKRGKDFQPPQKLDHFLITRNQRGADGNLILDSDAIKACKPDTDGKVRCIPVVLHSDMIDDVFPTRYVLYEGKKVTCSGDGEVNSHGTKCPCPKLGAETGPKCKPNGILHCSIAVPGRASIGAVHKWRTTSMISIERMIGSLEQVLATVGALRGVPLNLIVEPVQVSPGGRTTTVYCCHIECREQDIQAVMERALKAAELRAAIGAGDTKRYQALLSSPGIDETPAEQSDVAEEFYVDATEDVEIIEPEAPQPSQADRLQEQIKTNVDPVEEFVEELRAADDPQPLAGEAEQLVAQVPGCRPRIMKEWRACAERKKAREAKDSDPPWVDPSQQGV